MTLLKPSSDDTCGVPPAFSTPAAPDAQFLLKAFENAPDLMSIADSTGHVVFANAIHESLLGYRPGELVGVSVLDLVHPDDHAAASMALLDTVTQRGEGGPVPVRLRRKDGGWLQVQTDAATIDDGSATLTLFISRVMTGTPDARHHEMERLSAILHAEQATTPDGVLVTTPEGETISFNENYLRIWGLTPAQAESPYEIRMRAIAAQLVNRDEMVALINGLYHNRAESKTDELELLDGRTVEMHTSPFRTGEEIHGRVWFFRDVSERARAARQLQDSEERYRRLVELSPNAIAVHTSGQVRYVNDAALRLLGMSEGELLGRNVFEFVHPDDTQAVIEAAMERDFAAPRFVQVRLVRGDGEQVYVEMGSSATTFDGRPSTQTVMRDVTDRVDAERALRESEERYRALVETAPDAIFVHDGRQIVYANPAAASLLGFSWPSELIGKDPWDVVRGVPRATFEERVGRVLAGETVRAFERRFLTYLGAEADLELALAPATVLGKPMVQVIMRDVSDRRRAEEERLALERKLLETQKLESLGLLAGGIAHDFNNLLVAIMGNAGLAMLESQPRSRVADYLSEIESAAQRAADLARQMLAYSGKGKFVVEPIDLSAAVRDIGSLLAVTLPKKALLEYHLASSLPTIEADATQIRQIVMNLVINAAEALGEDPGTISLETVACALTHDDLAGMPATDTAPGDFVCLRVSDSGCGMDASTAARIFDPFFTTKFTGRGLGLAAVLGIVRSHKGAIRVKSVQGLGTTFELFLPIATGANAPGGPLPERASRSHFSGRALVVDDESQVRRVTATMLSTLGFEVVEAASGEEGWGAYNSDSAGFAMVVADMTMPGMDGCELVNAIRATGQIVPAVIMSGYTSTAASSCAGQPHVRFLQKPFTLGEIERAVSGAIDNRAAP